MTCVLVRGIFLLACTSRVVALSFLASTYQTPSSLPLMNRGVFALSKATCDYERSVSKWARNDTLAAEIVETWKALRPKGLQQHDFGDEGSCVDQSRNTEEKYRSDVLTVVEDYFSKQSCPHGGKNAPGRFRMLTPLSFDVRGTPLDRKAPNRNYVPVWPYGRRECTVAKKCPVVVYLHGRDEHAESADLGEAKRNFHLVSKWGYLRYAERDPKCAKQLASMMLFPQILVGESWVADNLALMTHFVIPLLNDISERSNVLDLNRVSIVGYSEGALGSLQAALWHPDVFTFAVAAAVALPSWENVSMQYRKTELGPWKLRSIVATFGHFDHDGEVKTNMKNTISMVNDFIPSDGISLQFRLYAAKDHIHWENVFNQWPSLHDLLWKGQIAADRGSFFADPIPTEI